MNICKLKFLSFVNNFLLSNLLFSNRESSAVANTAALLRKHVIVNKHV